MWDFPAHNIDRQIASSKNRARICVDAEIATSTKPTSVHCERPDAYFSEYLEQLSKIDKYFCTRQKFGWYFCRFANEKGKSFSKITLKLNHVSKCGN